MPSGLAKVRPATVCVSRGSAGAAQAGLQQIKSGLEKLVSKGKLDTAGCAGTLARLKPGPVKADAPKVVLPDREAMKSHMDALIHHFLIVAEGFDVPAGEVYLPIESSKGELGVYMKSDGGPKPSRVHFRGPSFVNLSALPVMSEGEMVADVVAIIGSLDIVLGEIDR